MSLLENRIPPPFLVLLFAGVMWVAAWLTPSTALDSYVRLGLIFGFLALGLAFGPPAVRSFIRAKTMIDPVRIDRSTTLVTSGIYHWSRNPMYVGLSSLLAAWAAYLSSPWAALGPILFVLFISRFQIAPEERAMRARFGAQYEDYCRQVRRWL